MSDYENEQQLELFEVDPSKIAQIDVRQLVTDIVDELASSNAEFTAYRVSVAVNLALQELNSEYRVRSQMMYNYDRNGMIVRGSKDRKRFTRDEVIEFVVRFVERNRSK